MMANQGDQPTVHLPIGMIRSDMIVANPRLVWQELSAQDKACFLLVAIRTINHMPLPDPHWQSLVDKNLAGVVNGSLILSPLGVFLMQHVVETELAWIEEWMIKTATPREQSAGD